MSQAVYGIIINGRVWYVGSSKNFKKRKTGHKSSFNGAKELNHFTDGQASVTYGLI